MRDVYATFVLVFLRAPDTGKAVKFERSRHCNQGTMSAHITNWVTTQSLLTELLPAKYASIPVRSNPPLAQLDDEHCGALVWFVAFLAKKGEFGQLDEFVEHTGFNFMSYVCYEAKTHKLFPYELSHPMTFLTLWDKIHPLWDILCYRADIEFSFIRWVCGRVVKDSPDEMRDTCITFALSIAAFANPMCVALAIEVLPPAPRSLGENLVREIVKLKEHSYTTTAIRQLYVGFNLSDAKFLRGCLFSDVLRRHADCESREDGTWLLQRACELTEDGVPWFLKLWPGPKRTHKRQLLESLFKHFKYTFRFFEIVDFKECSNDLVTNLRRVLPHDFKVPEGSVHSLISARCTRRHSHVYMTAVDQLLGALSFDVKAYIKEEFQAVCVPKGCGEMNARTKPFRPLDQIPHYHLPGNLLLQPDDDLEGLLGWLQSFLAPSDLVYPDGFSCILPELAACPHHQPSKDDAIRDFLKVMGYTTANERKHRHPARKAALQGFRTTLGYVSSRIPEE